VYWVGPRNHVLDGGLDNHDRKGTIGEISGHETVYVLNVIRKRQHTCDAAAHRHNAGWGVQEFGSPSHDQHDLRFI